MKTYERGRSQTVSWEEEDERTQRPRGRAWIPREPSYSPPPLIRSAPCSPSFKNRSEFVICHLE